MSTNQILKTILHATAAFLVFWFAAVVTPLSIGLRSIFIIAAMLMAGLAIFNKKVLRGIALKTSFFFLLESIVLAAAAFIWYRLHLHKSAFLYEGVAIFFLSLAAFSFILRKKREVLFSDED